MQCNAENHLKQSNRTYAYLQTNNLTDCKFKNNNNKVTALRDFKFDKPFKTTEGVLIASVNPPSGTSHI